MTQMNGNRIMDIDSWTHRIMDWCLPRWGGGGGGMGWDLSIGRCKLLCREWINNKVLLYRTGSYIQYLVINHNGKEWKKECIYVYN